MTRTMTNSASFAVVQLRILREQEGACSVEISVNEDAVYLRVIPAEAVTPQTLLLQSHIYLRQFLGQDTPA